MNRVGVSSLKVRETLPGRAGEHRHHRSPLALAASTTTGLAAAPATVVAAVSTHRRSRCRWRRRRWRLWRVGGWIRWRRRRQQTVASGRIWRATGRGVRRDADTGCGYGDQHHSHHDLYDAAAGAERLCPSPHRPLLHGSYSGRCCHLTWRVSTTTELRSCSRFRTQLGSADTDACRASRERVKLGEARSEWWHPTPPTRSRMRRP
jgi:hypothetical protein